MIYENVPDKLKDPKTKSYKFVSRGPVSNLGRDYNGDELSNLIFDKSKHFITGQFYSLSSDVSIAQPFSNASTNGARTFNTIGGLLGEEGAGVIANQFNKSTREALNKELDLRIAFYNATQVVNLLTDNNPQWMAALSVKNYRNDLINFLTDGYLPSEITAKFSGSKFTETRRIAYEDQLNVATYGVQIINLLSNELQLRDATKKSILNLLNNYQKDGGKKDFSILEQMVK